MATKRKAGVSKGKKPKIKDVPKEEAMERLWGKGNTKIGSSVDKDFKAKQQDLTELNGDGNRERGRYGEDNSINE